MKQDASLLRAQAAQAGITLTLKTYTDALGTTPLGTYTDVPGAAHGICVVYTPIAMPQKALTAEWRERLAKGRMGLIDLLYGEFVDQYWPPVKELNTPAQVWARGEGSRSGEDGLFTAEGAAT